MLDLYEEFRLVVTELERAKIEYALCGGLAVSIYAEPRATVDLDFMVMGEDLNKLRSIVQPLGFNIPHPPMDLSGGKVVIHRLTKVESDGGDHVILDLIIADREPLKRIFESRQQMKWEAVPLWVVSREGLIELKRLRGSTQDLADIEKLEKHS